MKLLTFVILAAAVPNPPPSAARACEADYQSEVHACQMLADPQSPDEVAECMRAAAAALKHCAKE